MVLSNYGSGLMYKWLCLGPYRIKSAMQSYWAFTLTGHMIFSTTLMLTHTMLYYDQSLSAIIDDCFIAVL